jgi:ABC-type nitrate/sulfonate/bicarbonate transport system ATPase subunit
MTAIRHTFATSATAAVESGSGNPRPQRGDIHIAPMSGTSLRVNIRSYLRPRETKPFFSDVRVDFAGGRISVLLGASGRGKTTFLSVLLGTASGVADAAILYCSEGEELSTSEAQKSGKIGILSQDAALVPWLSTEQNLKLPTRLNGNLEQRANKDIEYLINAMGLERDIVKRLPYELSFGMRQRVTLARALLYRPSFLLIDEAFTGLDPMNTKRMAVVLEDYVEAAGAVCLLVTHNVQQASALGCET